MTDEWNTPATVMATRFVGDCRRCGRELQVDLEGEDDPVIRFRCPACETANELQQESTDGYGEFRALNWLTMPSEATVNFNRVSES